MEQEYIVRDEKAHRKAGYYRRKILILQENFKLFTVLLGVLSLILLAVNISNAVSGNMALWLIVLLGVIWLLLVGGFVLYVLLGTAAKKRQFAAVGQVVYGGLGEEYALCTVEEGQEPLAAGRRVRLYEQEKRYVLLADGLDECDQKFWTKYNFKADFGRIYLNKRGAEATENGMRFTDGNKTILLKREEVR